MATVIIVIHLMVIVALVAVVLLQRSDGGALGIGGGGSNFLATRGQGNVLTRSTAILAAAFFATSIALTLLARMHSAGGSILDSAPLQGQTTPGGGEGGILNQLEPLGTPGGAGGAPATSAPATEPAPATSAPATSTPAAPTAPAAPGVPDSQ